MNEWRFYFSLVLEIVFQSVFVKNKKPFQVCTNECRKGEMILLILLPFFAVASDQRVMSCIHALNQAAAASEQFKTSITGTGREYALWGQYDIGQKILILPTHNGNRLFAFTEDSVYRMEYPSGPLAQTGPKEPRACYRFTPKTGTKAEFQISGSSLAVLNRSSYAKLLSQKSDPNEKEISFENLTLEKVCEKFKIGPLFKIKKFALENDSEEAAQLLQSEYLSAIVDGYAKMKQREKEGPTTMEKIRMQVAALMAAEEKVGRRMVKTPFDSKVEEACAPFVEKRGIASCVGDCNSKSSGPLREAPVSAVDP